MNEMIERELAELALENEKDRMCHLAELILRVAGQMQKPSRPRVCALMLASRAVVRDASAAHVAVLGEVMGEIERCGCGRHDAELAAEVQANIEENDRRREGEEAEAALAQIARMVAGEAAERAPGSDRALR